VQGRGGSSTIRKESPWKAIRCCPRREKGGAVKKTGENWKDGKKEGKEQGAPSLTRERMGQASLRVPYVKPVSHRKGEKKDGCSKVVHSRRG